MARHIMTVCVVCLLCAQQLPCEQHIKTKAVTSRNVEFNEKNAYTLNGELPHIQNDNSNDEDKNYLTDMNRKNFIRDGAKYGNKINVNLRNKRHAVHDHDNEHHHYEQPKITKKFISLIFTEYGQENGLINEQGFERMLKNLGLIKLLYNNFDNDDNNNETCVTNEQLLSHIKPSQKQDKKTNQCSNVFNKNTNNKSSSEENNNAKELCDPLSLDKNNSSSSLDTTDILNLCPILLHQLASKAKLQRSGCINDSILADINEINELSDESSEKNDQHLVWTYAFLSVTACSILGLVGVAIIPCMDSWFYNDIIQFLVALAVGTMTGDALLHLLPHSIAGNSETETIFKGLTCMGGIIFFYATEHGFTMISEWRKGKKRQEKQTSHIRVMRDNDSINNPVAGDKLCKSKYSSYPYCYDDIPMESKNETLLHPPNCDKNNKNTNSKIFSKNIGGGGDNNETSEHLLVKDVSRIADSNTISINPDDGLPSTENGVACSSKDKVTVILREHESSHHGHSHKHGHVHSPPESLSAVAWMIILGDGLHNFTDGMAIGAAFSENIAGGFSTSLAVFCHELPHELGDFAILIKAGMSAKSAICYNLLTSVLSFIGMGVGIAFGQSLNAAQWMFAAAAGLFIYIALVDMIPELSSSHKTLQHCLLQIFGMLTGLLLMLLIALFEHDLMTIFSPTGSSAHIHSHN